MRHRLVILVIISVFLSGCGGHVWKCDSPYRAVAEACRDAHVSLTTNLPYHCPEGAVADAKLSAKKPKPDDSAKKYEAKGHVMCKD